MPRRPQVHESGFSGRGVATSFQSSSQVLYRMVFFSGGRKYMTLADFFLPIADRICTVIFVLFVPRVMPRAQFDASGAIFSSGVLPSQISCVTCALLGSILASKRLYAGTSLMAWSDCHRPLHTKDATPPSRPAPYFVNVAPFRGIFSGCFARHRQALSSSGLAKKVAASAEAYHHAMLVYATNEES